MDQDPFSTLPILRHTIACASGRRLTRSDLPPDKQGQYPERTEADQAAWWVKHVAYAFSHNVDNLFWTIFFDDMPGWFRFCAFLNRDRSPKLIYYTQRLMAQKIDGFTKCEELRDGLVLFTVGGKRIYIAWGKGALPLSGAVRVTDIYGSSTAKDAASVTLKDEPVFVEPARD